MLGEDYTWECSVCGSDAVGPTCGFCGHKFNNTEDIQFEEDYSDDDDEPWYDDDLYPQDVYENDFADPGGRSALRAATPSNPRNQPCPTCRRPNMLTPKDVRLGYQCDRCADIAEGRIGSWDY